MSLLRSPSVAPTAKGRTVPQEDRRRRIKVINTRPLPSERSHIQEDDTISENQLVWYHRFIAKVISVDSGERYIHHHPPENPSIYKIRLLNHPQLDAHAKATLTDWVDRLLIRKLRVSPNKIGERLTGHFVVRPNGSVETFEKKSLAQERVRANLGLGFEYRSEIYPIS